MEPEEQGMSTTKKVAAGAAVGVAIPAAVGVAKKLIGDDDSPDEGDAEQRGARSRRSGASRRATSGRTRRAGRSKASSPATKARRSTASRSRSRSSGGSSSGRQRTKDQLYQQAKRLKIEGRSTMNKAQLERAVGRARS